MSNFRFIFIFLFLASTLHATEMNLELSVTEEIILNSSSSNSPHYLTANEWGNLIDSNFQALSLIQFSQNFDQVTDNISLEWGTTAGFNITNNSQLLLNELYGQIDWYGFSMYIGKKYHTTGSNPEKLSSGSMAVSSNASPIPQINMGFFDYVTVPFTCDIIQIKGNFANGFFEGDRYIDNVLYHEKSLYVKVDTTIGLEPYAGFIHEVQWGGDNIMGISLSNYWNIFKASGGGEDSLETDQINALGNHLGMWDFGIYGHYESIDFQIYYEHFFEDFSGINFSNGLEGLWGISIEPKTFNFIDQFLIEFLLTEDQGSSNSNQVDAYYNNSVYKNGWTNLNSIIGNSFFSTSGSERTLRIANNRMKAIQLGIRGPLSEEIFYTFQMAYVKYYIAYGDGTTPMYENGDFMWNLYGEMTWNYSKNLSFSTAMEYDFGTANNVFGALFSATWSL